MCLNKNIQRLFSSVVFGTLLSVALPVMADVQLKLEETEITGARELPKVLYIVPWKKTQPDPRPLPMQSLVDEILSPIDMDVFRRQVRYYDFTHAVPDKEAAPR